MKELSIEEKAKAYDEALSVALETYQTQPMYRAWLKKMFPELSESEDEKVRKILFEFFKNYKEQDTCGSETFNGIPTDNILAWLEKQGDKDKFIEKELGCIKGYRENAIKRLEKLEKQDEQEKDILEDAILDSNEDGLIAETIRYKNEKQGEQKPAVWSIFDYRTWQYIVADVLTKKEGIGQYLDNGTCKNIAKYMQEEWSNRLSIEQEPKEYAKGEDYGIDGLYNAIQILEKTLGEVEGYQSDDGILEHKCAISAVKKLYEQKTAWSEEDRIHLGNCIALIQRLSDSEANWLKSLKDRVLPQPKQEWSEEDETSIAVNNPDAYKIGFADGEAHAKEEQWKPSDEQMELLSEVQNALLGKDYHNRFTDFMWELKKLKEGRYESK